MKALTIGLLVICCAAGLRAADPVPGDTRERVLDLLGNARGTINVKGNEVLFYDRGTIELTGGKVTQVKLITEQQLAQDRITAERNAKLAAVERERLLKEGEDEKLKALADEALPKKSGAEQVAFWTALAAKYPGLDVSAPLQKAQGLVQEEARKKQEAALAAQKAQEEQPALSSSKRRKYMRAGLLKDEPLPPGTQPQ